MASEPRASESYLCIATLLPMRRWRDLVPLALLGHRVRNQAAAAPGNVAYATRSDFLRKQFRTLTIWRDRESINVFVRAEPHATAVRRMAEWAADGGAFAEWTSESPKLDWSEARRRLQAPTFYYRKPAT